MCLTRALHGLPVHDDDCVACSESKVMKQTLLDSKRAQNLGILFSGFKADGLSQLMDALGSVTELECFQLQKMATLKRFVEFPCSPGLVCRSHYRPSKCRLWFAS